jgi:hypothetical protein
MTLSRLTAIVAAALVIAGASTSAQSGQTRRYAGRPLSDVLKALQAEGLRIVFSSELVRADMRVDREPTASGPRQILDEVLAPHLLEARPGPGGSLVIVRATRDPERAPKPAAGTIRGRVVDARTGTPLPGVVVDLQGTSARTVTAADGTFQLDDVPHGSQVLFVSIVGYALARPSVDVRERETTEVTVPLADGTGAYTEVVTVTADAFRRQDAAAPAQQTLTSGDLQDLRGVLADDPFRAVQALPGVTANDDFRSEFSIRGSDFRHIGVMVDGIATKWLVHAVQGREDTGSVGLMNGDVLDRVTVIAGAAPQQRQGRIGAWIDFDLREGSRATAGARLAVSGSGASITGEGPLGAAGRGSWLLAARQSYLQWLLKRLDYEGTSFGFADVQSKLVVDVTPRQQLRFAVIAGRSKLEEQEATPGPNSIAEGLSRAVLATVGWRSSFQAAAVTQRLAIVAQDFQNHGDFRQELGRGSASEVVYCNRLSWSIGSTLVAEAGSEVRRLGESRLIRQFRFGAPASPVERRADRLAASMWTTAGDGRLIWTSRQGAAIDAGVRVSRATLPGETTASPWFLAAWPMTGTVTLRTGASLPRQHADLDQIAGAWGGLDARASRARLLDLAVEHRLSPSLRWQVTLYHRAEQDVMRLEDSETRLVDGRLIERAIVPTWRNALTGSARGVEALVQRRAAAGLSGWIGYSYGRARYDDEQRAESFPADFDQRHSVNAYGQYRVSPRTTVSARLRAGSGLPVAGYFDRQGDQLFVAEQRNAVRMPVYARLDVRANHAFNYRRRRLTLFVELLNVLGRTNYGPADGTIRQTTREAVNFVEKLIPFVPSAGFLFEF